LAAAACHCQAIKMKTLMAQLCERDGQRGGRKRGADVMALFPSIIALTTVKCEKSS